MSKTLLGMLAVTAALAVGCGGSKTYESSDGKMTVDKKGDTVNYEIKTKEGKATMTASDKGVAIPDTFPKDVPIPKGATPKMTMSQGKTELLHLSVPGSVAEVAKDYTEKLKKEGWEIESSMNMGDTSMVMGKKGARKCAAVVAKDDAGALVQLSVSQE